MPVILRFYSSLYLVTTHLIIKSAIYFCFILLINLKTNAQFPIPESLNTGAQSISISVTPGSFDSNWSVAYGDTLGPTSNFVPALVIDRCDGAWPAPNATNAKWIVYNYGDDCNHIGYGCVDLYFQRNIILPAVNSCNVPVKNILFRYGFPRRQLCI